MTTQHLSIEGMWDVTILYNVWPKDLADVGRSLASLGAPRDFIENATDNLSGWNAGYTFTTFRNRASLVFIGRADSLREFLNTVDHEIDHVKDHVASYYGIELGSEDAAYLQGYIGGSVFEFVIRKIISNQAILFSGCCCAGGFRCEHGASARLHTSRNMQFIRH